MLPFLSPVLFAQVTTILPTDRHLIHQYQEVRPLPGQLNDVPVFNSNSPEVLHNEGILLSTFPKASKRFPEAHLHKPLEGRFDIFTHHISRPHRQGRTLYQGLLIHNPTAKPITLRVLQGASFLTSADAPFIDLPALVEDPNGQVYSGPGSKLTSEILRRRHQEKFPSQVVIPPYQSYLLYNFKMPTASARSTLMRLSTTGPVYMANMALYEVAEEAPQEQGKQKEAPTLEVVTYRAPKIEEWKRLLIQGNIATPRDLPPTPLERIGQEETIYSRVAGISLGSEWLAKVVDRPNSRFLTIPTPGKSFSYPFSTVIEGTLGTRQIQSAPMIVRYPDTAYQAHGNYGVHYRLTFPLHNPTPETKRVVIALQTPWKQEQYADRLIFTEQPKGQVFFRGSIRVIYPNAQGAMEERYFHIVQQQGQKGEPLVEVSIPPQRVREVSLEFVYPPDATPPQVLTVTTRE
jgi:hypothetical protein